MVVVSKIGICKNSDVLKERNGGNLFNNQRKLSMLCRIGSDPKVVTIYENLDQNEKMEMK